MVYARESRSLSEALVQAGRALLLASYEDDVLDRWDDGLAQLAGYDDDGHAMIRFAAARPDTALRVWRRIAETRGLRGEPTSAGWKGWTRERRAEEIQALFASIDWIDDID